MKSLLIICCVLLLGGCGSPASSFPSAIPPTQFAKGALMPHHLFVEPDIEDFYSRLASPDVERVVLIGPNHFDAGSANIQGMDASIWPFVEPKSFKGEHSITVHFPFIAKHFPQAKITPLILKNGASVEELDALILSLSTIDDEHTFYIASIDFTHFVRDDIAIQNDLRTIDYLQNFDPAENNADIFYQIYAIQPSLGNPDIDVHPDIRPTAMDSPESVYVLLQLMTELQHSKFNFWKRTSSEDISGSDNPLLNTSHIFGWF